MRSKCWGGNKCYALNAAVDGSFAPECGQLGLGDANNRGGAVDEMGADLPSVDLGAGWTAVEVIGKTVPAFNVGGTDL